MMKAIVLVSLMVAGVVLANDYGKGYEKYEYAPMPFYFDYAVYDKDYYGNPVEFSHDSKSDGKTRTGNYKVLLPDGRTQIVNYKADSYGYNADVEYKGEAKYPEYKPSYKPEYKPEYKPAYKPSYH